MKEQREKLAEDLFVSKDVYTYVGEYTCTFDNVHFSNDDIEIFEIENGSRSIDFDDSSLKWDSYVE
eukprot:CAMPEP_0176373234 /NCGR_PEP_ID=MMETSP0126-20121128/25902_1 /TAXON_ID=141414 ORGANISM="Strombidinopsis acuminatum, Strain SPMC142" /NCGR_SAMPLE_ID=MMETSP0126 /ASSEMBLY_ACC=CAM_ASM_000229 /LENGTH=65 /DNA_ID=CAMNT_0017733303 /DNA_START=813 /DNA_END=1010 /DNA_ORIENTATION=+